MLAKLFLAASVSFLAHANPVKISIDIDIFSITPTELTANLVDLRARSRNLYTLANSIDESNSATKAIEIVEKVAAETAVLAIYHDSNSDAKPIADANEEKSVYSALVHYFGQTEVFLKSVASKEESFKEPYRTYLSGNLRDLSTAFDRYVTDFEALLPNNVDKLSSYRKRVNGSFQSAIDALAGGFLKTQL